MRRISIALLLFLAAATVASASNSSQYFQPFQQPDPNACQNCDVGPDGVASCYPVDSGGAWSACQGGQVCYYDPIQGWSCDPYCSNSRCLYV